MSSPLAGRPSPLPGPVLAAIRADLPRVAARTIEAVTAEVPSYRGLDDSDRVTLATGVELALAGFLALAASPTGTDPAAPLAPALDRTYELGRGEARAGRSMDSLLAAYRIGARTAWRGIAGAAANAGLPAGEIVGFAELVFAYIDALSAASASGHADELAMEGRGQERYRERLAHALVTGAATQILEAAVQRAEWEPPAALAALVLPVERADRVHARLGPRVLRPVDDVPDVPDELAVLLLPDSGARARTALDDALGGTPAVLGPARPWREVPSSVRRAARAWKLLHLPRTSQTRPPGKEGAGTAGPTHRGVVDADQMLPELVVTADSEALTDLRAKALAPLVGVSPAAAARLTETLRAWLLHRGRRDEVAGALFVHPQTVRYRMGQLRELYGDALDDPRVILELTVALALPDFG